MGLFFWRKKKKEENEPYWDESVFGSNDEEKVELDYVDEDATFLSIDKGIIEEALDEKNNTSSVDRSSYIENCCEQMASCAKRIDDAKAEYMMVNNYINDINVIENLDTVKKNELIYFAKRIRTLTEGKKELSRFSTKMPGEKYLQIQSIEDDIRGVLKDMSDLEEDCQRLKTDLHNIEGERVGLRVEEKHFVSLLNGIKAITKIAISALAVIFLLMIIGQLQFDMDMSIPIYGTIMLAVAGGALIIVLNQKYYNELKLTEMKKQKAASLLNKYKLRYVNAKSRLDYSYEKYGVKSAHELNEQWGVYLTVKKEREAYEKNNDELYRTISKLEEFLDSVKLYDSSVWPSQIGAILDGRQMHEIRQMLNVRRQKLRKSIDYNMDTIERYKSQVKNVMQKNPSMAKEIMEMLDRY